MNVFLRNLVDRLVRQGALLVIDHKGHSHHFGDKSAEAQAIRLTDRKIERSLFLNPELMFGLGYMDGRICVESGTIYDILALLAKNLQAGQAAGAPSSVLRALRYVMRRISQSNGRHAARRNIHHHYDLHHKFFELFLDPDMQYSCAYFTDGDTQDLTRAQQMKKQHIVAKLNVTDGMNVLDIGCGWGGMGLYLAGQCGCMVTGVTLSGEQANIATLRARDQGLAERARFLLKDYREIDGSFDRIVSVGMFEHVGVANYPTFFRKCVQKLKHNGVMLLHTLVRLGPPSVTDAWVQRYIFPGGYIPALSEIMQGIERSSLLVSDVEILRLHYAHTLRAWRRHFEKNRDAVRAFYDERFCRMWEFYLAASEVALRFHNMAVAQIQLTRGLDVLPITRDYITHNAQRLSAGPVSISA